MRPGASLRSPERGRPCGEAGLGVSGARRARGMECGRMGVSGGPRSSVVACSRERTPGVWPPRSVRGVSSPGAAPSGDGCPGRCPDAGGWGEGCEWCAGGQRAAPGEWCGRAG